MRRFVQRGTWSVVACCLVAAFVLVTAARENPAIAIALFVAVTPVVLLLSTLTIEIDDLGVCWYFTGELFKKRLTYGEIATCEARTIVPLGLGYRIGRNGRAWIVSGRRAVVFSQRGTRMRFTVGCDDPAAVCAELTRRMRALS